MSVEELIRQLERIEDKRKQVFVFVMGNVSYNYPLLVVAEVDGSITDRVDINVVESR